MKTIIKLLLTATVTSVMFIQVQAQSADKSQNTDKPGTAARGANFVDQNNDGVCDNFAAGNQRGRGANFVDKNNDGVCDNRGSGRYQGRGPNFTDANNDGICDHRQDGTGRGKGYRHRNGQGYCRGNRNR